MLEGDIDLAGLAYTSAAEPGKRAGKLPELGAHQENRAWSGRHSGTAAHTAGGYL